MSREQLEQMGFAKLGDGVKISDRCQIYGADRIEVGDNSRIDDFCLLSAGVGGIRIGRYVHLACYSSLIGAARIALDDFSCISARTSVFSSTDDFSGEFMTNPTVDNAFRNVRSAEVSLGRHVVVGAGSVILPGVEIGDGSAVGAMSLVKHNLDPSGIYAGNPLKKLKNRSRRIFRLERQLLELEIGTK